MEILGNEANDPSFPMKTEMKTWSLNPEAPEFFPSRNNVVFSANDSPFFTPTNPYFLHYNPFFFLAPRFSNPLYLCFPPPHATVPGHFPAADTVASLPSPANTEPDSTSQVTHVRVARKENMGGRRRRNKRDYWRAKPSSIICTVDEKFLNRKIDRGRFCNNYRGKFPLTPLKYDGNETTVMIKNIPNRYTREMLMDFLDVHCMMMNRECSRDGGTTDKEPSLSAFDFLYLPIDFISKLNRGYAFVNFSNPRAARRFSDECRDKHWEFFHSTKIREIYCAKIQGKEQLVKQFKSMEFPCAEFQPLCFDPARDGSKQSVKKTVIGICTGFA